MMNDFISENSVCILFCPEPAGYGKTVGSLTYTFNFPAERSNSVPLFTFNAHPFIFNNSLYVESAFLIKLFASCICTVCSL